MANAVTDADDEYKLICVAYPKLTYDAKPGRQIVMITTLLRNDATGCHATD